MICGCKVIAVCICKIYDERHYNFITALNKCAVENGYRLFVYHTCSDLYWHTLSEKSEIAIFDLIDYDKIDAVVTFDERIFRKDILENIRRNAAVHGKPVISVGDSHDDCTSVMFDYEKGFEQVVRHIVEQHGISDVAMIAGFKGEVNSERRVDVYKQVLEENDIPFREDRLYYGDYWSDPTVRAVNAMIAKNDIPKAVICANDMMAITASTEFQSHGYKVPNDIIITGFDGTEDIKFCEPMMTSCGASFEKTCRLIVDLVGKAINGEALEKRYYVEYVIEISESCGCERHAKKPDTGSYIHGLRDRINRYQDEERVLYELATTIMNSETPKEASETICTYDFGDVAVLVNRECFDEKSDPSIDEKRRSFDDKMIVISTRNAGGREMPFEIDRKDVVPCLDDVIGYGTPLVFSALGYIGIPQGYVCFYLPIDLKEYGKIPLYMNSLNTALGSYRNVRYQKYMAKHIEDMYRHDVLTGLYNRNGFYNALEQLRGRDGQLAMVVSVDVDGLKYINDNFGHEAGDFAIRAAAEAMSSVTIENKVCGRFGGDELAMVAIVDEDCSDKVKWEIKSFLSTLNQSCGKPYTLSSSVGIAVSAVDHFDFDNVMRLADKRMYEDKKNKPHYRGSWHDNRLRPNP